MGNDKRFVMEDDIDKMDVVQVVNYGLIKIKKNYYKRDGKNKEVVLDNNPDKKEKIDLDDLEMV